MVKGLLIGISNRQISYSTGTAPSSSLTLGLPGLGAIVLLMAVGWDGEKQRKKCAVVSDPGQLLRQTLGTVRALINIRHYRAPELLFSPMTYNPFALDIWSLGVVVTDCLTPVVTASHEPGSEDSDDDDDDPLDQSRTKTDDTGARSPRTLFDDSFGELGLAASIFRILGTPTEDNWPVSPLPPGS